MIYVWETRLLEQPTLQIQNIRISHGDLSTIVIKICVVDKVGLVFELWSAEYCCL